MNSSIKVFKSAISIFNVDKSSKNSKIRHNVSSNALNFISELDKAIDFMTKIRSNIEKKLFLLLKNSFF